jgi:hypothetical protein
MSQSKMFIPTKIKVGYQERSGTYTGKLAYVIYFDNKGKLRKEASWEGWRDKKIDPIEFTNVPTSEFVLNKGYVDRMDGMLGMSTFEYGIPETLSLRFL